LSHPITRPRRAFLAKGRWQDIVKHFNGLQALLSRHEILSIMPTAIDEYRIERQSRPGRVAARRPRLSARWPLPVIERLTLYSPPDKSDLDQRDLLLPRRWDFKRKKFVRVQAKDQWYSSISSVLAAFEHQIEWQVSSRDHLLVSWCGNLLVFRPFYQESSWSGGVQAEVAHWKLHAVGDATSRIGFIHFKEDVELLLKETAANHTLRQERGSVVGRTAAALASAALRLAPNVAADVIDFVKKGKPAGMLDKAPANPGIIEAVENNLPAYEQQARTKWLSEKLTGADLGHVSPETLGQRVGVWIFCDADVLEEDCESIASFFRLGRQPDTNYLAELAWVRTGK